MTNARYIVEAWASWPLPIARSQSPKWHINIIARECGLRLRRVWQSLRIFALPASLFATFRRIKGAEFSFFLHSFLLLVFHFFIFVVLSTLWTFTLRLAYLRACESAEKKMEKCATLWHLLAPLPVEQEQKKNTIIKKQKEERRAQSVM